eukprot:scaffold558069_cov34-Prasinocladus_malaysianus.AAC.1
MMRWRLIVSRCTLPQAYEAFVSADLVDEPSEDDEITTKGIIYEDDEALLPAEQLRPPLPPKLHVRQSPA